MARKQRMVMSSVVQYWLSNTKKIFNYEKNITLTPNKEMDIFDTQNTVPWHHFRELWTYENVPAFLEDIQHKLTFTLTSLTDWLTDRLFCWMTFWVIDRSVDISDRKWPHMRERQTHTHVLRRKSGSERLHSRLPDTGGCCQWPAFSENAFNTYETRSLSWNAGWATGPPAGFSRVTWCPPTRVQLHCGHDWSKNRCSIMCIMLITKYHISSRPKCNVITIFVFAHVL